MTARMNEVIEKDLELDINTIRNMSWEELCARTRKRKSIFSAFRPQHYFVSDDVYTEPSGFVDDFFFELRNGMRYLKYKVKKCLLRKWPHS